MPDYSKFNAEQFAGDKSFREWVFSPTLQLDSFWESWLALNPEKKNEAIEAKTFLLTLTARYGDNLCDDSLKQEIDEIVRIAEVSLERQSSVIKYVSWLRTRQIAAVLLVGFCISWFYYHGQHSYGTRSKQKAISAAGLMLNKTNDSNKEMTVLLSDNSVVTLMKGSSLSYPSHFPGNERKVVLTGEAFFDIAKDAKRPFLVFANETVTSVLGTSFRVKAFERDSEVMVLVKTGRVSVYAQKEYESRSDSNDREAAGVILYPNQQAVFSKKDNRLEKGIVANPGMLSVSADQELIFDDKSVSEILHILENIYGIVIVFDSKSLSSCIISTQFKEENLKERMNVICQAIGATYEMIDGQIILKSKGCSLE